MGNENSGNSRVRDIHYLSENNKNAILNFLRINGPASRADISRSLGLSFPAVSSNVKGLLEAGMICEAGDAANAMGRKGKLLAINTHRSYFIGLDLGGKNVCGMCADVMGKMLSFKKRTYTGDVALEQIGAFVREVIREAGIAAEDVAAIGVGLPDFSDKVGSAVPCSPPGYPEAEEIQQYLKDSFTKKIYFEKNANLGAVGERWKGVAQGYENIVFLDIGINISAGLINHGRLIRGGHNAAGAIGFMTLERSFLSNVHRGERSLELLIPSGQVERILALTVDYGDEEIDLNFVEQRLRDYLSPVFTDYMYIYTAMAVINTVALMDPDLVVISGRLGRAIYEKYKNEIGELVHAYVPFKPEICSSELKEKAIAYGAIAMAAEEADEKYKELFE